MEVNGARATFYRTSKLNLKNIVEGLNANLFLGDGSVRSIFGIQDAACAQCRPV